MVWALVAAIAAVLAVAIAATSAVLVIRRRHVQREDTFRCSVRVTSGSPAESSVRWRKVRYASWAHDVLVLRRGPALVRTCLLPVESARGAVRIRHGEPPWRLGPSVASLSFRLDDGSTIEISAPAATKSLLCGPYLLAVIKDSPAEANSRPSEHGP